MIFNFSRKCILSIATSIFLAGCMVGPDFHSPPAPQTKTYTKAPQPIKTASVPQLGRSGQAQTFEKGMDIPAEWWTLYHSPVLNELIRKGLANSPNLAAAESALKQAQELLKSQIQSTLYPAANLQLNQERQSFSSDAFGNSIPPSTFNLYNANINAAYTLDVFGALRRAVEATSAQVDYAQFQLEAAHLTLTSNIVTTAVTVASLKAQIQATHELIKSQESQLKIVKKQFQVGGVSGADVFSQESQVAQTRATLPPLQQNLAQQSHALAVLVGELPGENELPNLSLNQLTLPTKLPLSLPSLLVRQRPDIRAAEALLHVASAQVGVATANLYPQITLTGSYGWENNAPGGLFSKANNVWTLGAGLLQPLYDAGALRSKKRVAVAAFEEANAQYRQTVLQGFQNVADALRALENDAKTLRAQKQSEIAASNSLRVTTKQFEVGGVSYLSLLSAQRQYQQARISRIQAEAARYNDTAALFQALGGGWWNRNNEVTAHAK